MTGTDRYAYLSRLRETDPMPKLAFTAAVMVVCLCCDSVAVGLFTLVLTGALTTALGGLRPRVFLRFLRVPLVFLAVGCVTALFTAQPEGTDMLWAVPVGGSLWGFTAGSLRRGVLIFTKALGVIGGMYFLSLSTPITDLTMALERLHVPKLFVELMELIYRFIFVLSETAGRIRAAQESRLGYRGLRRSLSSLGTLASMVFLRAWKKGERVYTALESRGYTGSLVTLAAMYRPGRGLYPLAAIAAAGQLAVFWLERRVLL